MTDLDTALDAARFARILRPGTLASEQARATRLLRERLDDDDVAQIEQLIRDTPGAWEHYAQAQGEGAKRHVLLAFGLWFGAKGLSAKTGLQSYQPPEDVHAMARGPLAAAGGLYEADLIADALAGAGVELATLGSALDFGCSSGRVVSTLAAAYPGTRWHGCDPNAPAIAWAKESLAHIEFFVSGDDPPLPLPDASLDLVYAISIWSHFAPELGLRWFEEMHRMLRPGGHLLLTTHGLTSVAHYAQLDLRTPQQSREIADALYREGVWYAPEFGEEGDWGVVNPDWGTAFLTPEWLLTKLCPRWSVLEFAPGRNQDNQDVYVLRRV
ncbi:MAG TPA: class I SAM-dependent methyltransferase [Solirubrobacteraceae bacterium]|nr:class I SAM-dependent methyltransferase [Solirubrobacteraceae bacterium]